MAKIELPVPPEYESDLFLRFISISESVWLSLQAVLANDSS